MKHRLQFLILIYYINLETVIGQAFREGYYNGQSDMPGSTGDTRNMPSFPFSTDTNRYSDGYSSESIYSDTSPHFPSYNGYLANITDRANYHIDYIKNAAKQGIGLYGDGDAVIEDKKYKVISDTRILPSINHTFTVYAAIKWNPSGFAIQVGENYRIDVLGSHIGFGHQFWNDGGIRVNADGYESHYDAISNCHVALGRCRSHLNKRRRLLTANWMSLVCTIGEFVRPIYSIIPGQESLSRYVPIDESQVQENSFNVGLSYEFHAKNSGELIELLIKV